MPSTKHRLRPLIVRWQILRKTDDLCKIHAAQESGIGGIQQAIAIHS